MPLNVPTTTNFLSNLNFKFWIKRSPNLNFFITSVNIPSIQIPPVIQYTPFANIPLPGDNIDFSQLNITFKVQEDLSDYLEIHNWMKAIGNPDNFDEYRNLMNTDGVYSDVVTQILTNNQKSNVEIVYRDAFPVILSELSLSIDQNEITYIQATASFKYVSYTINKMIP